MYTAKLRYGELLLRLIRLAGFRQDRSTFDNLCDRFERLMASIPPAPLVREGDNA